MGLPASLVPSGERVEVHGAQGVIACSSRVLRVLETASPPTYYLPGDDVDWDSLAAAPGTSLCEWKGRASYFSLRGAQGPVVAWRYANPSPRFAAIHGYVSFYPGRVACFVDGERVTPQPGGFYGGWITHRIAGPVKGGPGTGHW